MMYPPRYTTANVILDGLVIAYLLFCIHFGLNRLAHGDYHGIIPWIGLVALSWLISRSVRRIFKFYSDRHKAVAAQREVEELEWLYQAPETLPDN